MCWIPDLAKLNRITKIWEKAENINEDECHRKEEGDQTDKNYVEQNMRKVLEGQSWESEKQSPFSEKDSRGMPEL